MESVGVGGGTGSGLWEGLVSQLTLFFPGIVSIALAVWGAMAGLACESGGDSLIRMSRFSPPRPFLAMWERVEEKFAHWGCCWTHARAVQGVAGVCHSGEKVRRRAVEGAFIVWVGVGEDGRAGGLAVAGRLAG